MACIGYTEKPNLRCWLSALRSTLFICHFRYSARRHAASTSMYAQVRHPWRTRPVCVIPKGRFTLLASCSSQSFVYLALSIQRSQACSKYFHVCSAAQSVAHMASTRYTERPNLRCWLSALRSTLFICVYLPLSIQRSQARSKYIHVCSAAPSVAHMACTRYTERPIYAAGFLLFAVLCLSGTFDTTLAGTQQVLPCMFSCAIRGAHGLYALYRKANLRCWLPALRSPLFIWHFRYNARRHAASTSMYVQLRHPWRTRLVRVIPKGRFTLLASCSSQPFVYLALSIQRSQARSKYIHVCSGAPSVAHMACTRYTERPIYAAGFLLFAVLCLSGTFDTTLAGTQQVHPCMFRCAILGTQGLYALYRKANLRCWLPTPSSQLSALGSRLSALGSRLSTRGSRLSAPSFELPGLNFSDINPSNS